MSIRNWGSNSSALSDEQGNPETGLMKGIKNDLSMKLFKMVKAA